MKSAPTPYRLPAPWDTLYLRFKPYVDFRSGHRSRPVYLRSAMGSPDAAATYAAIGWMESSTRGLTLASVSLLLSSGRLAVRQFQVVEMYEWTYPARAVAVPIRHSPRMTARTPAVHVVHVSCARLRTHGLHPAPSHNTRWLAWLHCIPISVHTSLDLNIALRARWYHREFNLLRT